VSATWLVVAVTGCREPEEVIEPPPVLPVLNIGLIPEQNIFEQKRRYAPLADYLGKKIDMKIELKVLSRYGNVINNFVSNDLDGAFFGSFTGALAQMKLGIEPLARPEYADGTSTYHGLIIVRKDSGIKNGGDMKGKRFVFVDKATTAGWLLPLHYFEDEGIKDHRRWLRASYFAGSHEGAIYDVLEQKADIGAAKNTVFVALARNDQRITNELTVLAKSPEVPENALGVRKDLENFVKARLLEALLNMDQDEEGAEILKKFGAKKFIPTTKEDYAPVFRFAAEIGLDLAVYDYIND
jgi:phosphonate transport system substrate-binding protein